MGRLRPSQNPFQNVPQLGGRPHLADPIFVNVGPRRAAMWPQVAENERETQS